MNPKKDEIFGHPKGLFILFFTEMWERFSFYGMRALLTLYLVHATTTANPGLGWSEKDALSLYGWYLMLVYVSGMPGGYIADKFLGQKKSVILGCILLVFGHCILAVEHLWAFYTGIGFIIAGVGFLKPNISTMVGGLYRNGDVRRDKGFTIFYMGINLGGFIAPLIVGYVGEKIGWHYGFALAGLGMVVGMITFLYGQKYLKNVGNFLGKSKSQEDQEAFKRPLTKVEKDRVVVLLLSFCIVFVFWAAFEQAGGLMNIYAEQKTNRNLFGWTIPATWFQSVNSMYILLLGLPIAGIWAKRKLQGKQSSALFKMLVGVIVMGTGFLFMSAASKQYDAQHSSSMSWLMFAYLFHTVGELCLSPVALSYITKLAPAKYASLMMGLFWTMTGLGGKAAGLLGESASKYGEFNVFTGIAIFCVVFAGLIFLFLKKLNAMSHGAEDDVVDSAEDLVLEIEH
ncbi:peptide MFS transporter [Rhizosphaericola mali]|uniref:Peptide MFS transporter n=1 Tax=Rhizosphaericola mali TaxID=2545455 RepID=A0A5P2GE60_9BACT|nr:peptide MFS transporter [Rhizosphaericola mali]QES89891.1 peptide MFS transporter [Rhizosphaericola mali]